MSFFFFLILPQEKKEHSPICTDLLSPAEGRDSEPLNYKMRDQNPAESSQAKLPSPFVGALLYEIWKIKHLTDE